MPDYTSYDDVDIVFIASYPVGEQQWPLNILKL